MRIAVVGLGKIGLPLAVQYASKGHSVVGLDVATGVIESVNAGEVPFPGEADLDIRLAECVKTGRLVATDDYGSTIPDMDAVVVVVPLLVEPATGVPDFRYLDAATTSIGAYLTSATTVIYETTMPVGTTRDRWVPMLESQSNLHHGTDFAVVYSPERVLTGRTFQDLRRYPKLIGAFDDAGAKTATDFYEAVLDFDERPDLERPNGVWDMGSPEAAEFAKLAETTYRDVNIGLANQFAVFADAIGIDIHKVVEASNSQPFSHIHQPGVAVGGHCIPVYPRLYLFKDPQASVVEAARSANEQMPAHAVNLLARALNADLAGARVVVLGAAYRGGVKETAVSGVFPLTAELTERGAIVTVHDPLYTDEELIGLGLRPHAAGTDVDGVIVHTDHSDYRTVGVEDFPGVKAVVDGRTVTDPARWGDAVHVVLGSGDLTRR